MCISAVLGLQAELKQQEVALPVVKQHIQTKYLKACVACCTAHHLQRRFIMVNSEQYARAL